MLNKYLKAAGVLIVMFILSSSLEACRKDIANPNRNIPSKTSAAIVKQSATVHGTVSSTRNTVFSTAGNLSEVQDIHNNLSQEYTVYEAKDGFEITSQEEILRLLDNTPTPPTGIIKIDSSIMNLNGRTIKIVYDTDWDNNSAGSAPDKEELSMNPKAGVRYACMQSAMKKLNFNIEWVKVTPESIKNDYLSSVSAGNKYADILFSSTKRLFPALAVKKALVPMDNFIDFNNDPLYNSPYFTSGTEFLGRRWGFAAAPDNIGYVVFYNKEIFEKEGFTDLQQLYREGKWTWDTMIEYGKASTHDYNNDGITDQWGLILSSAQSSTEALVLSNGADFIKYDAGQNTYISSINEPRAAKALQLVNDMINTYRIACPDNGTVKFEKYPASMVLGKVISDGRTYKSTGINYGTAPLPKGPDVSSNQFVDANGVTAYFIPVNTDPKISAAVIKESFTCWDLNQSDYWTKYDMLNTKLQPYLMNQSDVNWVIENFPSPRVSQLKNFTTFRTCFGTNVINPIISQTSTPAQALETCQSSLQNEIISSMQ